MEVCTCELLCCHGYICIYKPINRLDHFLTRPNRWVYNLILNAEIRQLILSFVSNTVDSVLLNI